MKRIESKYKNLQLIFVHIDADSPTIDDVIKTRWKPWLETSVNSKQWIAVIPVKMLESWLLADWQALESTFIIDKSSIDQLIGGVNNAEQILNPKKKVEDIIRRGKQKRISGYRENLAVRTELDELRRLPSFQILEQAILDFIDRL